MPDLVQLLNELSYEADGAAYESVWVSQNLIRGDIGRVHTLPHVELHYSASVVTSIEVSASGDGGATWPVQKQVSLAATGQTPEEVGRVSTSLQVSGTDIRLRVRFDQVLVSNIHVIVPPLIERGKHFHAVR